MDKKNIVVRKKSNETGNIDETQIPTNVVRDIFHEMFSKQQKDIFKLISGNLKITNDKINEVLDEIHKSKQICDSLKKENEKVNIKLKEITEKVRILEKTNKDIEESLTVTQDIQEKKVCELEKKIKNKNIIGEEEKNKLRQLEDRLRRNNLRIDGLPENDQETWDETEKKLLILFENKLNIRNMVIKKSKKYYYIEHLIKHKNDPKKTWDTIKEVIGTKQNDGNSLPIKLNIKNKTITNKSLIAETLNQYFVSVGFTLASKIETTEVNFEYYLTPNKTSKMDNYEITEKELLDSVLRHKQAMDIVFIDSVHPTSAESIQKFQFNKKFSNNSDEKKKNNLTRIQRRTRERKAFKKLKDTVPTLREKRKWTNRLDIIKHTCDYIKELQKLLESLREKNKKQQESFKTLID
nr:repetitive organellar protein-like [Hydra vulgaris]